MKKNLYNFLLSTAILAIFVLIATATGQEEAEKKVAEQIKNEPAMQVTSVDLYEAYEANEVSADKKYKEKTLEVSGKVIDIRKNSIDESEIIVTLNGLIDNEYEIMGISCYFDASHTDETATLSKGQNIKILGLCDGKLMGVNLKGCSIKK